MSLKNGKRANMTQKKSIGERLKEVWEVKEFKYGILVVLCLIVIFVLQILGIF